MNEHYNDDCDNKAPGWFVAVTTVAFLAIFAYILWYAAEKGRLEIAGNNLNRSILIVAPGNEKDIRLMMEHAEHVIILED